MDLTISNNHFDHLATGLGYNFSAGADHHSESQNSDVLLLRLDI